MVRGHRSSPIATAHCPVRRPHGTRRTSHWHRTITRLCSRNTRRTRNDPADFGAKGRQRVESMVTRYGHLQARHSLSLQAPITRSAFGRTAPSMQLPPAEDSILGAVRPITRSAFGRTAPSMQLPPAEDSGDLGTQRCIGSVRRLGADRATDNSHNPAKLAYAVAMLTEPHILHRAPFAKYAYAFRRISMSKFALANSLCGQIADSASGRWADLHARKCRGDFAADDTASSSPVSQSVPPTSGRLVLLYDFSKPDLLPP